MKGTVGGGSQGGLAWSLRFARAMAPWIVLCIGLRVLLVLAWPPHGRYPSAGWWISTTTTDLALILPFLLFAGAVALASAVRNLRRVVRIMIPLALLFAVASYGLSAWVSPILRHHLDDLPAATAEAGRFGPSTPDVLLDILRDVEANPPDEYSLGVDARDRSPPNVLRWRLHVPVAQAVFGVLNVLLGVLAAQLTANLPRGARRNARLAIGVIGGSAYFLCLAAASPIQPFLRDGTLQSGVLSAWAPLTLPLIELLALLVLVRSRYR